MSSRSSTESGELPRDILVGRVRRPHGIRGAVLIEALSDVAERFAPGDRLTLAPVAGAERQVEVARSSTHGDALLVAFEGVDDRNAVDDLRGAEVFCSREASPAPPDGSFYYYELVGCRCVDGGEHLGSVVEVIEDGGGHVLRIEDGARGLLVPLVADMVARVDVEDRRLELDLPEGLVEACAYRS